VVAGEAVTGVLVGPNRDAECISLLRHLSSTEEPSRRGTALIKAIVPFVSGTDLYRQYRTELTGGITMAVKRYRERQAHPADLVKTLDSAVSLCRRFSLLADLTAEEKALMSTVSEDRLLVGKKAAVAEALLSAAFWDEFVAKTEELGATKWSFAELSLAESGALEKASEQHYQLALSLEASKQFDRAFDEARRAVQLKPCERSRVDYLKSIRHDLLEQRQSAGGAGIPKDKMRRLKNLSLELKNLKGEKSQYVLQRIADAGPEADSYIPLQKMKAERLIEIGRISDAREVVLHTERTVIFTPEEREDWNQLVGQLDSEWNTVPETVRQQIERAWGQGQFRAAAEMAGRALSSFPDNTELLKLRAYSAAFGGQSVEAHAAGLAYLEKANAACAGDESRTRMLGLLRDIELKQAGEQSQPTGGDPHWITGIRYRPGSVYYDPVSLGFAARIHSLTVEHGQETIFQWAPSGYKLEAIRTTQPYRSTEKKDDERPVLYIAPTINDNLYTLAIDVGTSSGDKLTRYPLQYINTPDLDFTLLNKYGEKRERPLARGFAGNPFFLPFYWRRVCLFDLTYDSRGRVIKASPAPLSPTQRPDPYSETLTFEWDDRDNRLLRIAGKRYQRTMQYDESGRLVREKMTHPEGEGSVEYEYRNKYPYPVRARVKSDFYEKGEVTVLFSVLQ
jgi:hypothetical protein